MQKFTDTSSKHWAAQHWKDKIAAGFTNSATINGDKFSTIQYFWTLSQQHGHIGVGLGILPANTKAHGPADLNWTADSAGALATSPSDASRMNLPLVATLIGKRVAYFTARLDTTTNSHIPWPGNRASKSSERKLLNRLLPALEVTITRRHEAHGSGATYSTKVIRDPIRHSQISETGIGWL